MWIDDEGNELDSESAREEKSSSPARSARGKRQPQAPSWSRTLKRGAIFAPIMFGTVLLLSPKLTQTLLIVGIFIPFSYFVDQLMYRSFLRRQERGRQPSRRGN